MSKTTSFKEEVIERWSKSETAKRVESVEIFAQIHGFGEFTGQNIPDFFLTEFTRLALELDKELEGEKETIGIGDEIFNIGISKAQEIIRNKLGNQNNWRCGKCDRERLGIAGDVISNHSRHCPKHHE